MFRFDQGAEQIREQNNRRIYPNRGAFRKFNEGDNEVRLYPFAHTITEFDFLIGRALPSTHKVGQTIWTWTVEQWRHYLPETNTFSTCVALVGQKCAHCARSESLCASDSETERRLGFKMKRDIRYVVNACNVQDSNKTIQIYDLKPSVYIAIRQTLELYAKKGWSPEGLFGDDGSDWIITYDASAAKDARRRKDTWRCAPIPQQNSARGLELQDKVTDLMSLRSLLPGVGTPWFDGIADQCPYGNSEGETTTRAEGVGEAEEVEAPRAPIRPALKAPAAPAAPKSPEVPSAPRGRGRPKGSKNKPKVAVPETSVEVETDEVEEAPTAALAPKAPSRIPPAPKSVPPVKAKFQVGDPVVFTLDGEQVFGVIENPPDRHKWEVPPPAYIVYVDERDEAFEIEEAMLSSAMVG